MDNLELDGSSLSIGDFEEVVFRHQHCVLGGAASELVARGRKIIDETAFLRTPIYGITTGFGDLASVTIDPQDLETLQERLILSHAAGVGDPLPVPVVRGMLLLRINTLARGHSGVRIEVVELLLSLLNHNIVPVVPSRGSVGASGDLAPLAHLALPLLGRGEVNHNGQQISGSEGLAAIDKSPITLKAKEGLALINGTQAMTALLGVAVIEIKKLVRVADWIGALTTDALRGTDTAFDERIHRLRSYPGQVASAGNLWQLMQGSRIRESHRLNDVRVQDPYCIRCMPQVHGALRDVLDDVQRKIGIEFNAVTDNPLVFPDDSEILSGGNFHGQPMALAADFLTIALAELGSISERRTEKLTNTAFSALPPFLVKDAGLNSGFMIAQVTAAALVSENKTLAHPASVDSIPTSADKEDHVSMGMWGALKLHRVLDNVVHVIAIELLAAAQGINLLRPLYSSEPLEWLHSQLRERVSEWTYDREMAPDIKLAVEVVKQLEPECVNIV